MRAIHWKAKGVTVRQYEETNAFVIQMTGNILAQQFKCISSKEQLISFTRHIHKVKIKIVQILIYAFD